MIAKCCRCCKESNVREKTKGLAITCRFIQSGPLKDLYMYLCSLLKERFYFILFIYFFLFFFIYLFHLFIYFCYAKELFFTYPIRSSRRHLYITFVSIIEPIVKLISKCSIDPYKCKGHNKYNVYQFIDLDLVYTSTKSKYIYVTK